MADGDHVLSWGPRAGVPVRLLASTDEGRGHLVWISRHYDAPVEDRRAAREALAATRPAPSTQPAVSRPWRPTAIGIQPGRQHGRRTT